MLILVNLGLSGNSGIEALQSNPVFYSPLVETPVTVEFNQTGKHIILNLSVEDLSSSQVGSSLQWRIEGEGIIGQDGKPDLPAISRYVTVPDAGKLSLSYKIKNKRRIIASKPVNYTVNENVHDLIPSMQHAFTRVDNNALFPSQPVTMSEPMIMRGVRMVALTFYPLQWDEANQEYVENVKFQVDIIAHHETGKNEVRNVNRQPSRGFDVLIDNLLVNPPTRDRGHQYYLPGGYLVVADENIPEAVQEFIDWKSHVGHRVDLLSVDGGVIEAEDLRNRIQDVYDETGFEFLVIMGTDDAEPPLHIPMDRTFYDTYYAQLEGEDILPDVAVGTFNCITEENFICAIRRSISYQYTPFMENTEWFTRAGIGVGACSVPNDLSPSYTGKWVTEVLSRTEFDDISTSYFSDNAVNDPSPMIQELYDERTNFILVRAHMWDLDVDNIDVSTVYPFQFLCSSGTISPPDNGAFNWIFRQGTPEDMKGASAGFGHQSSPRTNVANALAGGLAQSMFMFDIGSYGWARNYTVANLARVMVADGVQLMPYYYSHWRYYGDPGQGCWVGVPSEVQGFDTDETINLNATSLRVHVDLADGEDAANSLVTLSQGEDIMISVHPQFGDALLAWESGELTEGIAYLTVTSKNTVPLITEIEIVDNPVYIALTDYSWDDEQNGNGDGVPNSGESGTINATFTNISEDNNIQLVNVTLELISSWLEIVDFDGAGVNELQAGASIIIDDLNVTVRDGCPDQTILNVAFQVGHNQPAGQYQAGLSFKNEASSFSVSNTEGELVPDEQSDLSIIISNRGSIDSSPINARLESLVPFVVVVENDRDYPGIEVGSEAQQNNNAFVVETNANTIAGSVAWLRIILEGGGVLDTLYFTMQVGEAEEGDPLGPDSYGYIALSNNDDNIEWAEAPEYDWIEICPWLEADFEGRQIMEDIDDEEDYSELIDIPFPFRYYGEEFRQITVCSNGWIAAGDQSDLKNQQNWLLPGIDGAYGMMAVFWDRLHFNGEEDGICVYLDEAEGRFIIEWNGNVEEDREPNQNAFQVILYDANRHVTPTGDSPILYQYRTVNNVQDHWEANAGASVGISSPVGLDGLTYTYWNEYPVSCSRIIAETAILWSTISYAPLASISGRVDRWVDSTAVAGATVRTSNGFQTTTSGDGSYRIVGFEPGQFDLTVFADRYGEIVVEGLEAEEGEAIDQDVILPHVWLNTSPDSIEFYTIVWNVIGGDLLELSATGEGVCNFSLSYNLDESEINPEGLDWGFFERDTTIFPGDTIFFALLIEDMGENNNEDEYYFHVQIDTDNPQERLLVPVYLYVTSVDEDSPILDAYELSIPYPNPFNSSVNVSYVVPAKSHVSLVLYDLSGKEVRTLVSGQYSAGNHTMTMQADGLATGIYFVRMEAGEFVATQRLLLLR